MVLFLYWGIQMYFTSISTSGLQAEQKHRLTKEI